MQLVPCEIMRPFGVYSPGEMAGFPKAQADLLANPPKKGEPYVEIKGPAQTPERPFGGEGPEPIRASAEDRLAGAIAQGFAQAMAMGAQSKPTAEPPKGETATPGARTTDAKTGDTTKR